MPFCAANNHRRRELHRQAGQQRDDVSEVTAVLIHTSISRAFVNGSCLAEDCVGQENTRVPDPGCAAAVLALPGARVCLHCLKKMPLHFRIRK